MWRPALQAAVRLRLLALHSGVGAAAASSRTMGGTGCSGVPGADPAIRLLRCLQWSRTAARPLLTLWTDHAAVRRRNSKILAGAQVAVTAATVTAQRAGSRPSAASDRCADSWNNAVAGWRLILLRPPSPLRTLRCRGNHVPPPSADVGAPHAASLLAAGALRTGAGSGSSVPAVVAPVSAISFGASAGTGVLADVGCVHQLHSVRGPSRSFRSCLFIWHLAAVLPDPRSRPRAYVREQLRRSRRGSLKP